MWIRIAAAVVIVLLMSEVRTLWLSQQIPALTAVQSMQGEQWYRLANDGQDIGFMHTSTRQQTTGNWIFSSRFRYALTKTHTTTMDESLEFSGAPPFTLVRAHQSQQPERYTVHLDALPSANAREDALPTGAAQTVASRAYHASITRPGDSHVRTIELTHHLPAHLSFEAWLLEETPAPGSRRAVRSLDFARLDTTARTFELEERSDSGYVVTSSAPGALTRITLDPGFVVQEMAIAGLFHLSRAQAHEIAGTLSPLHYAQLRIPIDRRIADATRAQSVELRVVDGGELWPGSLRGRAGATLYQDAPDPAALRATARYPATSARIAELAADLDRSNHAAASRQLLRRVNQAMEYDPSASPHGVLDALEHQRGDCTEFADLFTAAARHVGIAAHTVIGLAYSDTPQPAFALHAWNEVWVNGMWQALDPTWNQATTDATHIHLPDRERIVLEILTGDSRPTFELQHVDYASDL